MAALQPHDKSRILYHLGYLNVSPVASLQFGIPRPIESMFLIEQAMNNIIDDGYTIQNVLRILGILDQTECRIAGAQPYLVATRLGNLETNPNNPDLLEKEYNRWADRLADIFGVPRYPYSRRSQEASGVMGGNVRVRH